MFSLHSQSRPLTRFLVASSILASLTLGGSSVASAAGWGYGGGEGGHGHPGEGGYDVVQIVNVSTGAFSGHFHFNELECSLSIAAGTFSATTTVVVERSHLRFSSHGAESSGSLAVADFRPHSNTVVAPLHPEVVTCFSHEFDPSEFAVINNAGVWSVVGGATGHSLSVSVSGATPFAFVNGRGDDLLALGSVGHEVALLQQLLHLWGYSVTVTGHFTSTTATALSAFQTSQGLSVTATTTLPTWYQLELK